MLEGLGVPSGVIVAVEAVELERPKVLARGARCVSFSSTTCQIYENMFMISILPTLGEFPRHGDRGGHLWSNSWVEAGKLLCLGSGMRAEKLGDNAVRKEEEEELNATEE